MIIKSSQSTEKAFSIVELLIAMLIGLILIAGVMTIYVSTIKDSRNLLSSASLSQELTAVMSILLNDIRRSGSYHNSSQSVQLKDNPFYALKELTPISVPPRYKLPFAINISSNQDCISFAYDAENDSNSTIKKNNLFAFRLKNNAIQTLQFANIDNFKLNGCANNAGSWMNMTDSGLIRINKLHINTQTSQCININNQNKWQVEDDEHLFPCLDEKYNNYYSPGDRLVEIRMVNITIEGNLTSDATVIKKLSQTIRVRNDVMVSIPMTTL